MACRTFTRTVAASKAESTPRHLQPPLHPSSKAASTEI